MFSSWKCLQYRNPYCNSRYTRTETRTPSTENLSTGTRTVIIVSLAREQVLYVTVDIPVRQPVANVVLKHCSTEIEY